VLDRSVSNQDENGATTAEVFISIEIGLASRCDDDYETSEEKKPQVTAAVPLRYTRPSIDNEKERATIFAVFTAVVVIAVSSNILEPGWMK
jgi:hypothetical protein